MLRYKKVEVSPLAKTVSADNWKVSFFPVFILFP